MKILIFNWRDLRHSWAGGGEIYIFEQAVRWAKMGNEVTVFCGQDIEKDLPDFEIINKINIYRKGGRFSLYFWAIWYYLTQFRGKFDVVIDVQNGIPFFTPFYSRTPKICYVYHVHNKQFFYELPTPLNYIGYIIERYIFPIVYRNIQIIAISETTKKQLIKINFDKKNIKVVYSGIQRVALRNKNYKKFYAPTILYLGRIKKYKRVNLLVNIFSKIVEKVPSARLTIAGWGTEASIVADLVMRNVLRRKITLLGPISDKEKRDLLSKSWLFVNPSIGEGWSIAVIEANLYGTPAVSFDVPGLAESIQSGKTGLLAKNEQDFIEKICLLLTNTALRTRMSKKSLIWAKKFDWNISAKESLRIINKVWRKKNVW